MNGNDQVVPFHKAAVPLESVKLRDGEYCALPDRRRIEVWRVEGAEALAVRIFRPTADGRISKLEFGLTQVAGLALMGLLHRKLAGGPDGGPEQEAA